MSPHVLIALENEPYTYDRSVRGQAEALTGDVAERVAAAAICRGPAPTVRAIAPYRRVG